MARQTTHRPAQGAAHGRLGRSGLLGRPGRQPGRHRRPGSGRQRRRRGRGHRGRSRASPSPTAPASAAAASSSTTTPRPRRSRTIDGRETAPMSFTDERLLRTRDRHGRCPSPPRSPPGSPSGPRALRRSGTRPPRTFGTWRLGELLKPAERAGQPSGFVVDQTFYDQTAANARPGSRKFPATAAVFLPGGQPPAVGSTFRNPDMAKAYRELRTHGVASLYGGKLGAGRRRRGAAPARRRPASASLGGQLTTGRPRGVPGARQGPDHLAVQGVRRLRHARAELGRHRRRRDPQPHRGVREEDRDQPRRASTTPATCTGSPRRPRRRSPTGTATSATSPASRSRS